MLFLSYKRCRAGASIAQQFTNRLEVVNTVADDFDHYKNRYGQQHAPHAPEPAHVRTPIEMASGFILLVRLASQGVSRNVSSAWITIETPPTRSATSSVPNCKSPTIADLTVIATLPT